MKSLWKASNRAEINDRFARLAPGTRAIWGRMSAPAMLAHCSDSMRMALGTLPVKSKKLPLRYPPLKQFIIYVMPFPKGAPTAPELIARAPSGFETEVAELSKLIDQFAHQDRASAVRDHPAFGKLSARAWGVLTYRHMDHHLRQFGV